MHQRGYNSYVKHSLHQIFFIVFNYKKTTRQLNIKNRTYYFYNDLINVINFEAGKPDWNVNGVNPLYLVINRIYGYVSEKNGNKFLTIDKGDSVLKKYDQVFSGIKDHIKNIDNKEVNFNSDHDKIRFLNEDFLPLNKLIYFPTLTVVIRCVFKQNGVFYLHVYLDDCLYQI